MDPYELYKIYVTAKANNEEKDRTILKLIEHQKQLKKQLNETKFKKKIFEIFEAADKETKKTE